MCVYGSLGLFSLRIKKKTKRERQNRKKRDKEKKEKNRKGLPCRQSGI